MDLGHKTKRSTSSTSPQQNTASVKPTEAENYRFNYIFDIMKQFQSQRIWTEIDLDALDENLMTVKRAIGDKKILLAIKADAYGHGAKEIAAHLDGKVDMFGVAGVEEGISLRTDSHIRTPILILSPIPYSGIEALFSYNLTPSITEPEFAWQLTKESKKWQRPIKVHIEVDTGMGRTGLPLDEAVMIINQIKANPNLKIEGIFTHFPAADIDFPFTMQQIKKYSNLIESLANSNINVNLIKHIANSAGFLNFPESYFDMIRPGLIVYGINPIVANNPNLSLKPVMSLRTRIVNLRNILRGNSISYERTYFTKRDSVIGVITAGYGDGYPWTLSNVAEVIVSGRKAKVVGNVCMDLTMVDVTDIPNVKIGDVVTLIGRVGNEIILVNDLAKWARTIPYEIITRISPRVPRVFIQNGAVQKVRNLLNL